jgi:hypothetical protein
MLINDYSLIDPFDADAGRQFRRFAHAHAVAANRLLDALEGFVVTDTAVSCRIFSGGALEFFLVPPRYVLAHVPDAAAMIRVNHDSKEIGIVAIIEEYGGVNEQAQWQNVVAVARRLVGQP